MPANADEVHLSEPVAALADAVRARADGCYAIPEEKLQRLVAAVVDASPAVQRQHGEELFALVLKFHGLDAARTLPACLQLGALLTLLVQSDDSCAAAFASAGAPLLAKEREAIGLQARGLRPALYDPGLPTLATLRRGGNAGTGRPPRG